MDTNDPQIVKKHHKDLEYKAKALLANEASIFRPIEKKTSQTNIFNNQSKSAAKGSTATRASAPSLPKKKNKKSKKATIAPETYFEDAGGEKATRG